MTIEWINTFSEKNYLSETISRQHCFKIVGELTRKNGLNFPMANESSFYSAFSFNGNTNSTISISTYTIFYRPQLILS